MKFRSFIFKSLLFAGSLALLPALYSCGGDDEEDNKPKQDVPTPANGNEDDNPSNPNNPSTPGNNDQDNGNVTVNGHQAIDLGLPSGTKWATMNIGAEKPEDYGLYFAWGETKGYPQKTTHSFGIYNYTWYDKDKHRFTKYCTNRDDGLVDHKTTLELSDDAAHGYWGGSWRMPTVNEFEELRDNTIQEWTSMSGIYGRKITSKKNGNSIFMPATGHNDGSGVIAYGIYGCYWSSSLILSNSKSAHILRFKSDDLYIEGMFRECGLTIRPVIGKE